MPPPVAAAARPSRRSTSANPRAIDEADARAAAHAAPPRSMHVDDERVALGACAHLDGVASRT